MVDVTYFYRNPKVGFSITKVFNTITNEVKKNVQIEEFYVPKHRADPISLFRNILFVYSHRNTKGINHITGDIHYCLFALIGCKSVLTIHDLSAIDSVKNPLKKYIRKIFWFTFPLLIADRVVCISDHTRNELFKISTRTDVEVIYNAVDPIFRFNNKQFNERRPVVLQIGTAWNKNLSNVIKALSSISCHLRIIGSINNSIIQLLQSYNVSYSISSGLTDQEILKEYNSCDIISFCSVYEGFGMPIIEGNTVGRCVVTSSISPMNEIAGDAAYFVNPNDIISIEEGFKQVIFDANLRNQLISNGLSNAKRFQPIDKVLLYLEIYKSLR
jgi:glycosyltransferase involved in cell wall biosynthesis